MISSKEQTRVIDEFGMTQLDNVSSNKDVKLADYLFTITKTALPSLLHCA